MKIQCDPQADALHIKLLHGKVSEAKLISKNIFEDLDSSGNIPGLEILFVNRKFNRDELSTFSVSLPTSMTRKAA